MRMSQPGPTGHAHPAPWRRWLLPAAVMASFVTLLILPRGAATGMPLSYTRFLADVGTGTVRAVTIGPAGQVTGILASGQPFTTTIPVALGGNGLAGDLAAHHVQITATSTMPSSLSAVLIGLLPLLLIGGLLFFAVRNAAPAGGCPRRDGRAGRGDQGEDACDRRRAARHPVHRRGWLLRREDRDRRGCRLPARPRPLPRGRGTRPAWRAHGRAARHREDPAGPRGRR